MSSKRVERPVALEPRAQRDVGVAQDGAACSAGRSAPHEREIGRRWRAWARRHASCSARQRRGRRGARARGGRPRAHAARSPMPRSMSLHVSRAVERLEHGRARQPVGRVQLARHVPAHVPEDAAEVEDDGAETSSGPGPRGVAAGLTGSTASRSPRERHPAALLHALLVQRRGFLRARGAIALELAPPCSWRRACTTASRSRAVAAGERRERAPTTSRRRTVAVMRVMIPCRRIMLDTDHRRQPAEARVARRRPNRSGRRGSSTARALEEGKRDAVRPRAPRSGGRGHRHRHRRRADAPPLRVGLRRAARRDRLLEDGHDRHPRRSLPGRRARPSIGPVRRRGPIHSDEVRFAPRANAGAPLKLTMPGPMTIVDTIHDAHYGSRARLGMDAGAA